MTLKLTPEIKWLENNKKSRYRLELTNLRPNHKTVEGHFLASNVVRPMFSDHYDSENCSPCGNTALDNVRHAGSFQKGCQCHDVAYPTNQWCEHKDMGLYSHGVMSELRLWVLHDGAEEGE